MMPVVLVLCMLKLIRLILPSPHFNMLRTLALTPQHHGNVNVGITRSIIECMRQLWLLVLRKAKWQIRIKGYVH